MKMRDKLDRIELRFLDFLNDNMPLIMIESALICGMFLSKMLEIFIF
nr:MAG TPA_asm: hypothetical protein [Caudoviricetes sp.]